MRRLLTQCPICDSSLAVTELHCRECGTTLSGHFPPGGCPFCLLPDEQLQFLELFLRCRGNLRDVERSMGVSYPTVRARLDALLNTLDYSAPPSPETTEKRREILEALNAGRLTPEQAIAQLEEL
jgi:hypothetical protein